jgi:two-component system, cell cycle sensor histidine kinase and response regulator CckA
MTPVDPAPLEGGARFKAVIDAFADPLFLIDHHGVTRYVNAAVSRVLGYASAEVLARPFGELVDPDVREVVESKLASIGAPGSTVAFEHRMRCAEGRIEIAETTVTALDAPTGRSMFVLHVRIVTEKKRMAAQIQQQKKMEMVGQLAAGVAHDFNNLLTVINGVAEFEAGALAPGDPNRAAYEMILDAGRRAVALTQQLLVLGRRQHLQPVDLSLSDTVARLGPMLRRLIGEEISIVLRTAPLAGMVRVDAAQIDQVVLNLAINARDAMPGGGTLTIQTENTRLDESYAERHPDVRPGDYVRLSVTDTGCGMDEKTRERMFEPFFTTKAAGKGSGLGLAIVYGIVKQSGGEITCDTVIGTGTTFNVYLPRVS